MAKSRTSKSTLFRMIQQSPIPIYAVSTGMKIVFCNQALCDLTGHDDEFLTELTCVYQTASDQPPSRQLAIGLCPPPDSFLGEPSEGWVSTPVGRKVEFRRATFVPNCREAVLAGNESGEFADAGVIVFVHGPSRSSPEPQPARSETPDAHRLHAAISQMQYQSAGTVSIDRIAGISPEAQRIRKQVDIAGQSVVNVTIIGPRGSGRHNMVPLIHFANGPEMAGPLIPINCPLSDMESVQETIKELYRAQREYPDEPLGRVFLQEIDELSEQAQAELLGFLRLPDFRLPLIATALPEARDKVHPELWQHLNTLTIEVPSLSDRRADIPYLAQAIVEQFNDAHHAQLAGIEPETMSLLVRYSWPGELDELIEAIDAACRAATPPHIKLADLPQHMRIGLRFDGDNSSAAKTVVNLDQFLSDIEDELIRRAVAHTNGNKSEAARLLSISRPRLLRRLSSSNDLPDFVEAVDDTDEAEQP